MKTTEISLLRLHNQRVTANHLSSAEEVVRHLGAVQAQDYPMSRWALGARIPGAKETEIEQALNDGKILRTHVLRPTWHLVTADNLSWMLELTAPIIRRLMGTNNRLLGLTEGHFHTGNQLFEKALENDHLTREELQQYLQREGVTMNGQQMGHLLVRAEQDGVICSGRIKNGKQTYALLDERIPERKNYTREEAIIQLALTYFSGHGPASLQDFSWWSGLPLRDVTPALEAIKQQLESVEINGNTYWFSPGLSLPEAKAPAVQLLPAFDEFLISYKSREFSIPIPEQTKAFTNNGIFHPIIVVDGQVQGIWKRSFKKDKVVIEPTFFLKPSKELLRKVQQTGKTFGDFTGKKAHFPDQI